jgi:hypothetical protein
VISNHCEHMREVGLRVDAVKLGCAQQTVERGGAFAAIV